MGLRPYLDSIKKCLLLIVRKERTARLLEDPIGHSVNSPHNIAARLTLLWNLSFLLQYTPFRHNALVCTFFTLCWRCDTSRFEKCLAGRGIPGVFTCRRRGRLPVGATRQNRQQVFRDRCLEVLLETAGEAAHVFCFLNSFVVARDLVVQPPLRHAKCLEGGTTKEENDTALL